MYDSTTDTNAHIANVRTKLKRFIDELQTRGEKHDASKLQSPEKETYDKFTPLLKNSTYGSEQYNNFLKDMQEGLKHHYAHNSHHPEHYKLWKCVVCESVLHEHETWLPANNPPRLCSICCPQSPIYECEAIPHIGLEGMDLLDIVEMFCDWKAATERHADGDLSKSIQHNEKRFNINQQLVKIFKNTQKNLGW